MKKTQKTGYLFDIKTRAVRLVGVGETINEDEVEVDSIPPDNYSEYIGGGWVQTAKSTQDMLFVAKSTKKISLREECAKAISEGYTCAIRDGTSRRFLLSDTDQKNSLLASSTTNAVLLNCKSWEALTEYVDNTPIAVNGEYYICATPNKGVTGKVKPTFPTDYAVAVMDGTAAWVKYGQLFSTTTGNVWLSAGEILNVVATGNSWVITCRSKYAFYLEELDKANSYDKITAINWE